MEKWMSVVELPTFISSLTSLLPEIEKDALIDYIAKYPDSGDVIPHTGGLRKIRWNAKGKGKRGGIRVIYYFYNESAPIYLLLVYGKGQQENLTPDQVKKISKLVKLLKEECKVRRGIYE